MIYINAAFFIALAAFGAGFVGYGIFTGVRFLADSFRSDAIADYTLDGDYE